ncbi:ABC transporter ATP-binding protein [Virgisporangium aliadipatigenens]|uniref:ABC transporter ATP-binding protein n=2 Tax=Virgisporangium aliadipatigenens TaxID=741659 RepID=A0A8J4DNK5_9ACTN|nr:ABC transporter ATP-binding protein [Virgisporangium aliadipatigenens]
MLDVTRRFGATLALDGVHFETTGGEVHGLLGAPGAGKTTLMRILAGADRPDRGVVTVGGAVVTGADVRLMRAAGVALVQRHHTLVPTLTAGENLILARPTGRLRGGTRAARQRVERLADRYALAVRSDVPTGELSDDERWRLELLRALDADARLLLLDEPADDLVGAFRRIVDEGRSVVVATGRPEIVLAGCDRVTVLRAGRVALSGAPVDGLAATTLNGLLTGPALPPAPIAVPGPPRRIRLTVTGATLDRLREAELSVSGGEILGVVGLDGNGQHELEQLLAGLRAPEGGRVEVDGVPVPVGDAKARIAAGVAYLPGDGARPARWRPALRQRLRAGPDADARRLLVARELSGRPKVVVAAYPTRGLDPATTRAIVQRVIAAAARGAAVVWFGADLDELFTVADRVMVLAAGEALGFFHPPWDRGAIARAMTGWPS